MSVRTPSRAALRRLVTSPLLVMGLIVAVMAPAGAVALQRYDDVPATHRNASAIGWATESGLTNGCGEDRIDDEAGLQSFCAGDAVTRAQLMQILHNYAKNDVGTPGEQGPAGPAGPQGPAGASAPCPSVNLAELFGPIGPVDRSASVTREAPSMVVTCNDIETPGQAGCMTLFQLGFTLRDAIEGTYEVDSYSSKDIGGDLLGGLFMIVEHCMVEFGYDDLYFPVGGGPVVFEGLD